MALIKPQKHSGFSCHQLILSEYGFVFSNVQILLAWLGRGIEIIVREVVAMKFALSNTTCMNGIDKSETKCEGNNNEVQIPQNNYNIQYHTTYKYNL